ncbi:hypothetical protein ABZ626_23725 [Streptomyces longispororuber]|uniref:hypothetical protein n=1 Tax=Streptomyces longispororuber TaxID=68230 RepID=UPI00340889C7
MERGQHSAKILHEELLEKGYLGHYQRVKMAVAPSHRRLELGDALGDEQVVDAAEAVGDLSAEDGDGGGVRGCAGSGSCSRPGCIPT